MFTFRPFKIYLSLLIFLALATCLSTYFIPEPLMSRIAAFLYSQEYADRGLGTLQAHPVQEGLHRIGGAVFVLCGLSQFYSFKRFRGLHKTLGYVFILGVLLMAGGGITMAVLFPYAGKVETYSFSLLGIILFYMVFKGWQQIRRGNFQAHREWMLRTYLVSLSTMALRIYALFFVQFTSLHSEDILIISLGLGFITNMIIVESWIRKERQPLKSELTVKQKAQQSEPV